MTLEVTTSKGTPINLKNYASKENLLLAWRRITTGLNHQYKRYFRHLYYAYEVAIDSNLAALSDRITGQSFSPYHPVKLYKPKSSGLHRTLTLLSIDDQIAYQALANVYAQKLRERRKKVQLKSVFSNVLNEDDSNIFFIQDWHRSYDCFQDKIRKYFDDGNRWVAIFDLAAFYDTISHESLLRTLFPRDGNRDFSIHIRRWLLTWSSEKSKSMIGHGIPQGPIASDFLAECYLLDIDEYMSPKWSYVRYVDDIRIFGRDEKEVRLGIIDLEKQLKIKGLIPQTNKFEIKKISKASEIIKMIPSLTPAKTDVVEKPRSLTSKKSLIKFKESIDVVTAKVTDPTKAKYVLYRASPSPEFLKLVLKCMPKHPELIDAFVFHLDQYDSSPLIISQCEDFLSETPYSYVRGELWHVLAKGFTKSRHAVLVRKAIKASTDQDGDFSEKWGAMHFLSVLDSKNGRAYSRFIKFQDPLLQALLIPYLAKEVFYREVELIKFLFKRTRCEPSLMLAEHMINLGLTPESFDVDARQLPIQTVNVFMKLGLSKHFEIKVDPMLEILNSKFNLSKCDYFQKFLGKEYLHTLQFLQIANATFFSGRTMWLNYQNSFNHAIFLVLQEKLAENNQPGVIRLHDKKGKELPFGTMLDVNNKFSKAYPMISGPFRLANSRRNELPSSHPYSQKKLAIRKRTSHLRKNEQDNLVKNLQVAYNKIIELLNTWYQPTGVSAIQPTPIETPAEIAARLRQATSIIAQGTLVIQDLPS